MIDIDSLTEVDIRTVDKDTLVDVGDVRINMNLPVEEKIKDYIRQIKNPYCFLSNGVVVKIRFSGDRKLEDNILQYFEYMNQ